MMTLNYNQTVWTQGFILFFFCCISLPVKSQISPKGLSVLEQSKMVHDPNGVWDTLSINLHLQEPRIQNPSRYSVVRMDNSDGSFFMERNRESFVSTYYIDESGHSTVFLDDRKISDPDTIKMYRLDSIRSFSYRNFYEMMIGLPMSLDLDKLESIGKPKRVQFNHRKVFQVPIELKEAMFSKHWKLMIEVKSYRIIGIELYFPEDATKGERLYFEGVFQFDDISIPRMKHWHDLKSDQYLGSDMIIR